MIVSNFKGYIEGKDISKIPLENLAFPSKNVIVSKNKITTRGGLVNDGVAASGTDPVHSEFVWKDSLGGERPIRVSARTIEVFYKSVWRTIYTALDADVTRVYFATWVDINTTVVKKRLVFCDGSTAIYTWNGAIGDVESATTNTAVFPTADGTCLQQGFDAGNVTAQNILHFIGTAATSNSVESQTNDPTAQTLSISGTFNTTPVADDIIIAEPVKFADQVSSSFDVDVVYSFKNHLIATNFNSTNIYLSHIETYVLATGFDFTMPVAGSRTAITPLLMRIDGDFTAMVTRKNTLWISDKDDWYKVTKSTAQNAFDLWIDVEKFETGDRKGALPMAVARYKSDAIYVAQDKTVQRVITNEVLGIDEIRTISDDVEAMFERVELNDIRVNLFERAIYFICPDDSTLIILDMIEGYYQPPQLMPINCMSVIDGVKHGHHNATKETYKIFSERDDLDTPIESIIAFGMWSGDHAVRYKKHTEIGISCRLNLDTKVGVNQNFEEEGGKTNTNFEIDGAVIKTFAIDDDVSWATHPYAERGWGGADADAAELRRAFVFSKFNTVSYFEWQPKFTISGDTNEFHLLSFYIDDKPSERTIGNDLYVPK